MCFKKYLKYKKCIKYLKTIQLLYNNDCKYRTFTLILTVIHKMYNNKDILLSYTYFKIY